jgi:hypothetical protein
LYAKNALIEASAVHCRENSKRFLSAREAASSNRSLARKICKIADERRENTPTYKAVYRIVRELPKGLLVLAHEGTKAYAEAFDLIHR